MACRVGITTDPEKRKRDWEREHPSLRNWRILASGLTKKEAQNLETRLAKEQGCKNHPGGRNTDDPTKPWSVYRFEYD